MKDPLLNLDPPKRVQGIGLGIGFRTKKTTVTLTGTTTLGMLRTS